ncbi:unnamed protein product [Orchesella dallaii]|uniref:Thioredoxin-like fold domain-containing protein n=1 Tax=Orchesella dallaii TaxID=48710 RepID=A0ABP1QUK6_9HEXA
MNFDENLSDFGCGLDEEGSLSRNAAALLKAYARTTTVFSILSGLETEAQKVEVLRNYLAFCYEGEDEKMRAKNVIDISLNKSGFESITSEGIPDLKKDSLSSIILIEFFTHCCINCIHSIEDVREVHEAIEKAWVKDSKECKNGFGGMKVVSIHSPKFPREKDLDSIRSFCKRMKMDHSEVINDPESVIWNELGVTCWPTLLVLGPNPNGDGPNLLFTFMGEGHRDELLIVSKTAMEYFRNNLKLNVNLNELRSDSIRDVNANRGVCSSNKLVKEEQSSLRFPGKVMTFGEHLVVSDSGNNRVILLQKNGLVIDIIGGSAKGLKDGSFSQAQFYNPQGIAFQNEFIFYVADTGNHAIRKVDLQAKQVTTFLDSQRAANVIGDEESAVMKSPWDLCFYDDSLIIAAAGNHRLLGYFFKDTILFGTERKEKTFTVVAGSGREENRNNSYILKASFAQPSGITVTSGGEKHIYIADSESSTIRSVTPKGQVVGIIGGSRDPSDLFAFGDVDGKGVTAKLQHPMGVCCGTNASEIFIADTYNHKIKRIDTNAKDCHAIISSGLNEPSGICLDSNSNLLYVADTNNHAIKVLDAKDGKIHTMELVFPKVKQSNSFLGSFDKEFEIQRGSKNGPLILNFCLSPMPNTYEGGQWKVITGDSLPISAQKGNVCLNESKQGIFSLSILEPQTIPEFLVNVDVFFCDESSCLKRTRNLKINFVDGMNQSSEQSIMWDELTWN